MGEARAVASAGDLAAPLLGKFARSKVATARASIRALALIGTPAALDALQPYARDRRKTVVRELIRAWSQFDGEEFATRILRDAPLGSGTITVSDGAVLPFIFHLTRLKGLAYEGRWTMALTELSEPELVTSLSITRRYPRQDIEGFERFARLRSLNIAEPGDLEDISMLGGLPVTEVHLDGAHKLQDASALADCHALRLLDLDNTGISDLGFVAGTPALRHLWIGSTLVADVGPLQNAQRLRMLHMSNCERVRTIDGLSGLAELRWLWMGGCEQLASISGLEGCGQLEVLYLDGCSGLSDLGPIAQLDNLDELSLSHTSVRRLPSGAAWPSLRRLNLDGCRSLSLLGELDGLDGLVHLHCNDCVALESIDAVQACRAMRNLQMAGCVNVTDLSVVSRLPNLLTIDVSHCSPELDLVPLARHPRLRSIRATGMEAACERAGLVPVSSSPLGRYTTQRYRPRSRTSGS
jgi:internalin A